MSADSVEPPGAAAEWVSVETLRPWVSNPRKNDPAVTKIAESIKRFGFGAPLVARRADGELIAGHTRLKAAILLRMERVPVRYLDLDEKEAHLLSLADNKLGEIAEWDDAAVQKILSGYDEVDQAVAGFEKDLDRSKATEAREIDVTDVRAEFWLSVRGPLPVQPDAIEKLVLALESIDGVKVEHGILG